jgi:copper chaperone CopZ
MSQLKFKTIIMCGGCIATVKPHLEQLPGIKSWSVDTTSPDKTLTVEVENTTAEEIVKTVEGAGYKLTLNS